MKEQILDVLAGRYASSRMVAIHSPAEKIRAERRLWLAVMKAQRDLGLSISEEAIEGYTRAIDPVDFESIKRREFKLKHDVKARLEEFNELAGGFEDAHKALTAKDQTDNIDQVLNMDSLHLVRDRTVAGLYKLGNRATEFQFLNMAGRSHNVPGQTVTFGKRLANIAEEILIAYEKLEQLIAVYTLRGIKGAMGTQQDMLLLLKSKEKVMELEERVREYLGFPRVFDCVGQVYPRSIDYEMLSRLVQLSSGPMNFSNMIRLLAGYEQVHEGFKEGQTGSTAQPHKMNSRTSERIRGLGRVLGGYCHMVEALVGDQWFEGDVSDSVVRRVALPGAFFAIDGLYESFLTVLNEMQVFPQVIAVELERNLPFLSSTKLLMAAIQKGMPREKAHEILKRHSTAALIHIRGGGRENRFLTQLCSDPEWPLRVGETYELVQIPDHGLALEQVGKVITRIRQIVEKYPDAALYEPEPIL